jgi:hypothetical protein
VRLVTDSCFESVWDETVKKIIAINQEILNFWGDGAPGWAPERAVMLLAKSRLDWQVSLSNSLNNWRRASPEELGDGDLILAWANLGCLVEGTMKLMLAVFYEDYSKDLSKPEFEPDALFFDTLIKYFKQTDLLSPAEYELCELVKSRRNAIHAFKNRDIGNAAELLTALKSYHSFLVSVESRLPTP